MILHSCDVDIRGHSWSEDGGGRRNGASIGIVAIIIVGTVIVHIRGVVVVGFVVRGGDILKGETGGDTSTAGKLMDPGDDIGGHREAGPAMPGDTAAGRQAEEEMAALVVAGGAESQGADGAGAE